MQTGVIALGAATVAASKLSDHLGEGGLHGALRSDISDLPKLGTALATVVAGLGAYSTTM